MRWIISLAENGDETYIQMMFCSQPSYYIVNNGISSIASNVDEWLREYLSQWVTVSEVDDMFGKFLYLSLIITYKYMVICTDLLYIWCELQTGSSLDLGDNTVDWLTDWGDTLECNITVIRDLSLSHYSHQVSRPEKHGFKWF